MSGPQPRTSPWLAAVLCLSLTACGVGGIAIAAGGGGGGGGGGDAKRRFPTSTVKNVPRGASGVVAVEYELLDPFVKKKGEDRPGGEDDPRLSVTPQFRIRGVQGFTAWFDMTEFDLDESDGTRGVPLGPRTFIWNATLDLPTQRIAGEIRVLAEYEPTAEISRRIRTRSANFDIDNSLTSTVFGGPGQAGGLIDTFPVDVRPAGVSRFLVAAFGGNIVEAVDQLGDVTRVVGLGIPGDTGDGGSPGSARLQSMVALEVDPALNVLTNHSSSIRVTNRGAGDIFFGGVTIRPKTIDRGLTDLGVDGAGDVVELAGARGLRLFGTNVLVFIDRSATVFALNPQRPGAAGSAPVTFAGVTLDPGAQPQVIVGNDPRAEVGVPRITALQRAFDLAFGPQGELYILERDGGAVQVLNPTAVPLTVGPFTVNPEEMVTVAGGGAGAGADPLDGVDATLEALTLPEGIDVRGDGVLFIAETGRSLVRAVNLSAGAVDIAGTTVDPGQIQTVVGAKPGEPPGGGEGSLAREFDITRANNVTVDTEGNLLICDSSRVLFVNTGVAGVNRYGRTVRGSRTAFVYDASNRGGQPLVDPRALATASLGDGKTGRVLFVSDRTSVRALNFSQSPEVFGTGFAAPGQLTRIAGGSVRGVSGDGGPARDAAFSRPSGLHASSRDELYVADTVNGRIRFLNLLDPALLGQDLTRFGVTVGAGDVDTVVGGGAVLGDGGDPRAAMLSFPEGVVLAPFPPESPAAQQLMWITDTAAHRIRVVNPGPNPVTVLGTVIAPSTIETVFGNGTAGDPDDGDPADSVDSPTAITADFTGLIYFADAGNHRIKVINTRAAAVRLAGIDVAPDAVVTLVGNGVRGNAFDLGFGPDVRIDTPRSLVVENGTDAVGNAVPAALYFADGEQHVVRVLNMTDDDRDIRSGVTLPGGSVVSVAGGPNNLGGANAPDFDGDGEATGEARFAFPWGIALGELSHGFVANEYLFVADSMNGRVRRVQPPAPVD